MIFAVIMAGGRGERFWPKSRTHRPKQFLQLFGEGTLLQQAFRRARRLAPPKRVLVVTGDEYRDLVAEQLPELSPANILTEPLGRDTAPCIGLAALCLERLDPEATMVVLPADHAVFQEDLFAETLADACRAAVGGPWLVTVGLRPTRPETGYGYIQCGEPFDQCGNTQDAPAAGTAGHAQAARVRRVRRFTEKPDAARAAEFLLQGDYLWNSGMFAWRVASIRQAIARHQPDLHAGLEAIRTCLGTAGEREALEREFPRLPRVSIDYAVLEKADDVLVVSGEFGWDDLGTWAAMPRVGQADDQGNVVAGRAVLLDSKECIIEGGRRLVVTFGVEKLVVVDTEDVLFVSDAGRVDQLKQVVAELQARGLEAYLAGREGALPVPAPASDAAPTPTPAAPAAVAVSGAIPDAATLAAVTIPAGDEVRVVEKPWGREVWWAVTENYVGKFIEVRAGQALSLQFHREKRETIFFVRGSGQLLLGERSLPLTAGLAVTVEPGTVHRIIAATDILFLEVSTPEVEDVVRLEDRYGRAASLGGGS